MVCSLHSQCSQCRLDARGGSSLGYGGVCEFRFIVGLDFSCFWVKGVGFMEKLHKWAFFQP